MQNYRKIFGVLAGIMTVVTLLIPILIYQGFGGIGRHIGYVGYFFASCLGVSMYTLPFVVKTLNPILLIVIGAFGLTLDEFFPWYAGTASETLDNSKKFHRRIQAFIEKNGLRAVFGLSLLPLPTPIYAISGFAAGHFKVSFYRFFLASFLGKLVRTAVLIIVLLNIL